MLLGRERERQKIDRALEAARSGHSAVLGLIGEAGIGKTALLDDAARRAGELRPMRVRGIESEAEIPFASLLELLRPALGTIAELPSPQARALEEALALRPGSAQDRFAVGAATLSLLAAYADAHPLLILIDDAHWLDNASAQALLFALRRLVADPIAVLITAREGERSLLDGAGLDLHRLGGLGEADAAVLLSGLAPEQVRRLQSVTAGNPLALLELAGDADGLELAPEGAPVVISARVAAAFTRRLDSLPASAWPVLALAAADDRGDIALLARAAAELATGLEDLAGAEAAGLIALREGRLEFRHPLARSAVYGAAPPEARRAAHRALAAALPDRDVDRRAWHLAAAAVGPDEPASAALAAAGARARERSAYGTGAAAFERAARLAVDDRRRARLFFEAAEARWLAGQPDRAEGLLREARRWVEDRELRSAIAHLEGQILVRRGPLMSGYAVLTAAAEDAEPGRAAAMLAEAAAVCFYAARPAEMMLAAERALARVPPGAPATTRFMAAAAHGMARVIGGDAAAGAAIMREAIALAERELEPGAAVGVLPWMAVAPLFVREAAVGRGLLDEALRAARASAALGMLPFVLALIARDQATTDRWAVAESTYAEAIALAREAGQEGDLAFALAGLAWLQARRGRERECRDCAAEALALAERLDARLVDVWALAALGELTLAHGEASLAVVHFEDQRRKLAELGVTDVDLWPTPELVDALLRLGRAEEAAALALEFAHAAQTKGQPWSLARALRAQGMTAAESEFADCFERALLEHAATPDVFETARTQLAYGERLRRARNKLKAREQLRLAAAAFERLDARPWAQRARVELAATGERLRGRDPSAVDELTPQELQIALLLAGGRTTREVASTLFLSPKTVEYHLRHVYLKLDIHSRAELAEKLSGAAPVDRAPDGAAAPAALLRDPG
ncbi:MAG TPA: LuxR family transcriptional regulator [Solirubrobacteraceae bacterium]|nr:LuxR family transcriptional regulator [Solirubrobacteraceae bacterium]